MAALIELPNNEFWEITPFELVLKIDAFVDKQKREQEERLILTYAGAAWQRSKKMPRLNQLLGKEEPDKKMTAEEMYKVVKQLNAAFGGEVK